MEAQSPLYAQVKQLEGSIQVGGMYQHYKGKRYKVVSLVWQCESDMPERWVIYQGLYCDPVFGDQPLFTRSLAAFMETTLVQGQIVPRFAYCGHDT